MTDGCRDNWRVAEFDAALAESRDEVGALAQLVGEVVAAFDGVAAGVVDDFMGTLAAKRGATAILTASATIRPPVRAGVGRIRSALTSRPQEARLGEVPGAGERVGDPRCAREPGEDVVAGAGDQPGQLVTGMRASTPSVSPASARSSHSRPRSSGLCAFRDRGR
jgi:hypothetical protein